MIVVVVLKEKSKKQVTKTMPNGCLSNKSFWKDFKGVGKLGKVIS